jgi:hypothetical protein
MQEMSLLAEKLRDVRNLWNQWFMQDGVPPLYSTLEWAPRLPDLNPLSFAFLVILKAQVYAVKIQHLHDFRQRITDCFATVHPNTSRKIGTNVVKLLRTSI